MEIASTISGKHVVSGPQLLSSLVQSLILSPVPAMWVCCFTVSIHVYVYLTSKAVPSTTLCVVLFRQPLYLTATSPKLSISGLYQLLLSRGCTVDDFVCSPTPAASLHLTATSKNQTSSKTVFNCSYNPLVGFFNVDFDICVFFRTCIIGLQVKIFDRFILSLAISIICHVLVILAIQFTVELFSDCNHPNP